MNKKIFSHGSNSSETLNITQDNKWQRQIDNIVYFLSYHAYDERAQNTGMGGCRPRTLPGQVTEVLYHQKQKY